MSSATTVQHLAQQSPKQEDLQLAATHIYSEDPRAGQYFY